MSSTTESKFNNYWNRETSSRKAYDTSKPITQDARIICIANPDNVTNKRLYDGDLPTGANVVAIGSQLSDFDTEKLRDQNANVIFVDHHNARELISHFIRELPSISWIHSKSAGIDYQTSPILASSNVDMTNAKGCYSSTLAEYTMMAIAYFAKDIKRLMKNKKSKNWEKYNVKEIRGAQLGIIGYGDIGKATARLAKAYGMRIVALKRKPPTDGDDTLCDEIYFTGSINEDRKKSLHRIMSESDYVLCAAPLTPETKNMFDKEAFDSIKKGCVFINVGRGPIVDEDALIEALKGNRLKGAGLDVFAKEPLPSDSELWRLENVLLSPHNMDQTETFQQESVDFFVDENLPRFLKQEELLNPVDKVAGY